MDHDHAHTTAAPSAGASASVTLTESLATSEEIQILKKTVYGAKDTQMTCWMGKSDSDACDELYCTGPGKDSTEVEAVFYWETLLLTLTEPCIVPGTDLVASEVQLDMWEDEEPAEDRIVEDGIPPEISTEYEDED